MVGLFSATGARRSRHEVLTEGLALAGPFALGTGAMFLLDGAIYWHLSGDFFYKYTSTRVLYSDRVPASSSLIEHLRTGARGLELCLDHHTWTAAVVAVGLPAMLLATLTRGPLRLFGAFGAFYLLYLLFGSSSLTRLVPLPFQFRYLVPVIPFAGLCIAALVTRAPRWLGARTVIGPVLVAAAHLHFAQSIVAPRAGNLYFARYCQGVSLVAELTRAQDTIVYGDPRTLECRSDFVRPALHAKMHEIPDTGPLPPGLYMLHPRGKQAVGPRAAEIERLPQWADVGHTDAAFAPLGWVRPEHASWVPVYVVEQTKEQPR